MRIKRNTHTGIVHPSSVGEGKCSDVAILSQMLLLLFYFLMAATEMSASVILLELIKDVITKQLNVIGFAPRGLTPSIVNRALYLFSPIQLGI